MASGNPLLVIEHLSKRYPGTAFFAIEDISLQVLSGEVYGFLGANGAGKSTTIRTLLNFIQPSGGKASIAGLDSVKDSVQAKRHVGYLSGEVALYQKSTASDLFEYLSALQPPKRKTYLDELVKRFDVSIDKPIETLSKGNRQKVGIVQAFMHEPDVLILDEPTSGLDPLMQEEFFKLVDENKQRGAAIFLSSHNLDEAQRMCDKVGIIRRGKLVREQPIDGSSEIGAPVYRISLAKPAGMEKLKKAAGLRLVSRVDETTVLMQPTGALATALAALSKFDIRSLTSERLNLEEEFMKFYEDGQ